MTSALASTTTSPSATAALGLVGGFAAGQATGRRDLAGALFGLAGAWSARQWARSAGATPAAALTAGYVAAMGVSHPLAKRLGSWPSVLLVTGAVVAASEIVARRAR